MGIQSIRCSMPCYASAEEQTSCSLISRIAASGLGCIALLVGILVLSGISGLNALGAVGCVALTAAGGLVLLASLCLRSVKEGKIKGEPQRTNKNNFYQREGSYSFRKSSRNHAISQSHSTSFTYRDAQLSEQKSVINTVMSGPDNFHNLSYDQRKDEDIVAAAISGCSSSEQAKKVLDSAHYDTKKNKKVTLALVKVDPTRFEDLSYDQKKDEDIVAAAISGCSSSEQAKKVLDSAHYDTQKSKKVTLALVKVEPIRFEDLRYDQTKDEDIVAAAISGCKSSEQVKKVLDSAHYE